MKRETVRGWMVVFVPVMAGLLQCRAARPVPSTVECDIQIGEYTGLRRQISVPRSLTIRGISVEVAWESGPSSAGTGNGFPTVAEVDGLVHSLWEAPLINGRPIPYTQFRNDCEDRAVVASAWMMRSGGARDWLIGKIFLRGHLATAGALVQWGYHVAPFVVAAGDGGAKQILVIDPAINNAHGIPLEQWVGSALPQTPAPNSTARVTLRNVQAFNNHPVPGEDDRSLCTQVPIARAALSDYIAYHQADTTGRRRGCMRVHQISAEGDRVWLVDVRSGGRRTGWYMVNQGALASLQSAEADDAFVRIEYGRVDLGMLRGNVLQVTHVERERDASRCEAPVVRDGSRTLTLQATGGGGEAFHWAGSETDHHPTLDLGADARFALHRHFALGAGFSYQTQSDVGESSGREQYAERYIVDGFAAVPMEGALGGSGDTALRFVPRLGVSWIGGRRVRDGSETVLSNESAYGYDAFGMLFGTSLGVRHERASFGVDLLGRVTRGAWGSGTLDTFFSLTGRFFVGFDFHL